MNNFRGKPALTIPPAVANALRLYIKETAAFSMGESNDAASAEADFAIAARAWLMSAPAPAAEPAVPEGARYIADIVADDHANPERASAMQRARERIAPGDPQSEPQGLQAQLAARDVQIAEQAEWVEHLLKQAVDAKTLKSEAERRAEELAVALAICVATMSHARVFVASRERIHPDGMTLYDVDLAAARRALERKP
jgi:hypothetical protein